jgi:hypothetical protein
MVAYQPSLFAEQARDQALKEIYELIDKVLREKPVRRYKRTLSIKDIIENL